MYELNKFLNHYYVVFVFTIKDIQLNCKSQT